MAARLNTRHTEEIRAKIQASVIIERMHRHVLGELEMTASQVNAANSLLDRSVPKLSQIQHSGDPDNPIKAKVLVEYVAAAGGLPVPAPAEG